MSTFENSINTILKHEGGYVNDPNDPGGATNYGVSLRTLKEYGLEFDIDNDGDVDVDDIKKLPVDDAKEFYKKYFWDKNKYDLFLNQDIATKVFDMCVNMGAKRAHIILQKAANLCSMNPDGLIVDGNLGPKTFKYVNGLDKTRLMQFIREEARDFYLTLIEKNSKLSKFKNGWLKRASS